MVQFSARPSVLFLLQRLQIVTEDTQRRAQWVSGALSSGLKRPVHEANQCPPSSDEVKNE
jgi:hypothetical protein